jgi:hypothetical protein
MFSTILTALAPTVIAKGAKYLYEYSGIGDVSFMGKSIGDYLTSEQVSKSAASITRGAIEQRLLPDFGNMPQQANIPASLGQVSVGPPGGFNVTSGESNLLYTGRTGAIENAMKKTGVQDFFIRRITPESTIKFRRLQNRKIKTAGTSLDLGSLKSGQIERAL